MLDAKNLPYRYRDYRREPLTADELRAVLKKLEVGPGAVLRKRDPAYATEGLAEADDAALIEAMARHPTLLQRPIGVLADRAAIGRPPERLLALFE